MPTTFATGYRYAGLGYTTVFDAAIAPLTARHTHHEMSDTPCIDAGCFVLMGNDDYLLKLIDAGERDRARDYVAWLLGATGGYAIKVVNPGGVEAWKTPQRNLTALDEPLGSSRRHAARGILETLTDAADDARAAPRRAHPLPTTSACRATWRTTLESFRALEGRRAHFTHLQFHAYGTGGGWKSAARELSDWPRSTPIPSSASTWARSCSGRPRPSPPTARSSTCCTSRAAGSGSTSTSSWRPAAASCRSSTRRRPRSHALQWAIGLELFLLAKDPWRVVLSTDHPNGGSFLATRSSSGC